MGWIPHVKVGDRVKINDDWWGYNAGLTCDVIAVDAEDRTVCVRDSDCRATWVPPEVCTLLEPEDPAPEQVEHPPLGITPRHIVEHQRSIEILEAMLRYKQANKDVPLAWLEELTEYLTKKG